ncbi:MAG: hypothetical protein V4722_15495 [Bacteroidota bacterium]
MKKILGILFLVSVISLSSIAQVWQWSVKADSVVSSETNDHPQAFLWIPENCKQVRGVVFTQHNMIEEGILENVLFRKTMTALGFAEIWVTPALAMVFDFTKDAGADFDYMMQRLADVSGYEELVHVPVIPMGHSALASFPWNFAAWNPGRTLAAISIHGDAPLTRLTGSGKPNPDWGGRTIDGVPCLFVMGEYEWWEDRIQPGFDYVAKHPLSPISFFADAGHGHFDYSDELIAYLCMYIRKSAQKRLTEVMPLKLPAVLNTIDPKTGWLMDRWHRDSLPNAAPAPYPEYAGDKRSASWAFDREIAAATESFYARARGKINQHIGFIQNGQPLQPVKTHSNYNLKFMPLADGVSFTLKAFFSDSSGMIPVTHFSSTPLLIDRICGPVKKIDDTTFRIDFNRLGFNNPKRSNDTWLLAHNKGDATYKSAVQQLDMHFPLVNKEGASQKIEFDKLANVGQSVKEIALNAVSSAKVPVCFYVKEGPAIVKNNKLEFTKIPPRTKFPVKVTVVAWQYGKSGALQSAEPVEQSFYITR